MRYSIDWTGHPDLEKLSSGYWVVIGTRVFSDSVMAHAGQNTPEEIAADIYPGTSVDVIRRIVRWWFQTLREVERAPYTEAMRGFAMYLAGVWTDDDIGNPEKDPLRELKRDFPQLTDEQAARLFNWAMCGTGRP